VIRTGSTTTGRASSTLTAIPGAVVGVLAIVVLVLAIRKRRTRSIGALRSSPRRR
jgi:hypothetical protein